MKKAVILLLIIICSSIFGLERTSFNLKVPSGLDAKQYYMDIIHRMRGNNISVGQGANIALGLRYRAWNNIDVNAYWIKDNKEYNIGASYAYYLPKVMLRSQVDVNFFSYEKPPLSRRQNFFYNLSLQTEPFGKIFVPTVNVAYDGYNQKIGLGAGADFGFNLNIGPVESVNVIGEYFPVLNRDSLVNLNRPKNSFAFGLKFNTYQHQFMFMVHNNWEITSRRLMLGAPNNNLHFGFVMNRFQAF